MKHQIAAIRFIISLSLLLLYVPLYARPVAAPAAQLLDTQILPNATQTQIIFELNKAIAFRAFTLANPPRVVIDLPEIKVAAMPPSSAFNNTLIQQVRTAFHPKEKSMRIVLDLRHPVTLQTRLTALTKQQYRLTVQLTPRDTAPVAVVTPVLSNKTIPPIAAAASKTAAPASTSLVAQSKKPQPPKASPPAKAATAAVAQSARTSAIVIVIDPGHGGKDPGTTGVGGTHEKTVVLAIARLLQQAINRYPGFHAVLTRDSDYFIPLRGRLTIARQNQADMFVSIHADAYKNHIETGASVFALSERGATSEAARWLAEKENSSELMGGLGLPSDDPTLRSVLMDLTQTHTIDESLHIGSRLLQKLHAITPLRHNQVEQAAFVVLKSPDIPSLLVETGFLTTPSQEHKLRDPYFQQQIAEALALGITTYFTEHPPAGKTPTARAASSAS